MGILSLQILILEGDDGILGANYIVYSFMNCCFILYLKYLVGQVFGMVQTGLSIAPL